MNKPIYFDAVFVRHYRKRVLKNKKLHELYKKAITLFIEDSNHPKLKNHKLKGKMKPKRAFFIDDDCRVIFLEESDSYLFLDVGKHDEVYR
jgi:mRNA-degrading endonuclease YafQ of YafQ-DinJ toxin-antitoxin module